MGHLARCSAVGAALSIRGFELQSVGLGLAEQFNLDGISWLPEAQTNWGQPVLTVIDGYGIDEFTVAEEAGSPVVSLDPPRDPRFEPAAFLDLPGIGERQGFRGLGYACLRRAFWRQPRAQIGDEVSRVLVSTGGSGHAMSSDALAADLADRLPGASVCAVMGPFADPPRSEGVELLIAPENLVDALSASDLAVTAAGQTMLEAVAVGVPTVGVPIAENQVAQADLIALEQCALICNSTAAPETAAALARDHSARLELSSIGRRKIDGLGAHRVALRFLEAAGALGGAIPGLGPVSIREVTPQDSEFLLALRNEERVRAASRSTHVVTADEHAQWLQGVLRSGPRILYVVEADGVPAGQVRLDGLGSPSVELSVSLVAASRGHGLGLAAIRTATAHAFAEHGASEVVAEVRKENAGSRAVFERAGYSLGAQPSTDDAFDRFSCEPRALYWD